MGVASPVTEREFQQQVIDLAQLTGWKVAHFRPARTERGWRTPVQGDVGFPDLVLLRPPFLWLPELKSKRGRATPEQQDWIDKLNQVRIVGSSVMRPDDWPTLEAALRQPA